MSRSRVAKGDRVVVYKVTPNSATMPSDVGRQGTVKHIDRDGDVWFEPHSTMIGGSVCAVSDVRKVG